jgi:hypothetical protein
MGIRLSRGVLATQSVAMGIGGIGTLFLGVIVALSGGFLPACISLGIAALACCIAVTLWWFKSKLHLIFDKWGLSVLLAELALILIGVAQLALENALPAAQNQGTDNPFADGGNGFIALTGLIYVIGGFLVIVLFIWEFVWKTFQNRTK